MTSFYAYSLLPVLSVALLLFSTALRAGRGARGLASLCLSVAVWSGMLLLLRFPGGSAWLGERLAAIGAFVAAGYLHAAYDTTRQRRYHLVWLAYAIAASITLGGALSPGVIYGPAAMAKGPLFWPTMALAVAAVIFPSWHLGQAWRTAPREQRPSLARLLAAGVLVDIGGMSNAVLLAHNLPVPIGMFLVLGGLLVLADVIREHEPPPERRLLERSLLYAAIAAFLSAGFLFGVLSLMSPADEPLFAGYRLGALLLLFTALLAFEPVRHQLQEVLGRGVMKDHATSTGVAHALVREEARAEQATRLAELGTFTSAVAHEVRNPLGVLAAHVKLLERRAASDRETLAAMQEQIDRASRFVDDLLRYGRPRPLELRIIDVRATAELAISTARQGLGLPSEHVVITCETSPEAPLVEADQAQLSQALVILLDNALLALEGAERAILRVHATLEGDRLRVSIEDSGPGIPPELLARLFSPFVTGRKREGPRPGTGLGLAIARGIVERHHGTLTAGRSEALGGARFDLELPRVVPVLVPGAPAPAGRPR